MFVSKAEREFFEAWLQPQFTVLEYGSGGSTLLIQKKVKKLFSIEHQEEWFKKIKNLIEPTTELYFVPPDKKYIEGGHYDGSYNEFYSYINKGLEFGPYDLIYVDGRARVDCCRCIKQKLTNDGIIIFHDFERDQYQCLTKEFNVVAQKERMAALKPL